MYFHTSYSLNYKEIIFCFLILCSSNLRTNEMLICLRKMGRGMPWGIGFGSPDACECFQYAPDAGSAGILKIAKTGSCDFSEKTVLAEMMFLLC